ncbi:MAG: DUF4129 domain-containing protein [Tumebacillaceae bacterium]
MSPKWKRVYGLSVLSYAASSLTIFTIICGLLPNGTLYVPAYLFTGLALAAVSYWGSPKWGLPVAMLSMLIGIGSLFLINFEQMWTLFYPAVIFLLLAVLQWRRNIMLTDELQYARRLLLETYLNDVKIVIALALLTAFISVDSSWQMKVLPFFTAFMLTRMFALSLATKVTKEQAGQEGFAAMVQNKLPFVIVGVALFVCWVLLSTGSAIGSMLYKLLDPLFYGIGRVFQFFYESQFVPQWLKYFFANIIRWINEFLCWLLNLCSSGSGAPTDLEPLLAPELEQGNWKRVLIMLVVFVAIIVAMIIYYKMQNPSRTLPNDGAVEVREFIRNDSKNNKWRPRSAGVALTRMRKTYRKFLLAMHKRGVVRAEGETANELIGRLAAANPERRKELQELTDCYMEERYGGKQDEDKVKRAEQLTKGLTE